MTEELIAFLQHAVRLESDAAMGYERLAAIMRGRGKTDLTVLFGRFAEFSRLHLTEVRQRLEAALNGRAEPPVSWQWPDGATPENPLAALDQPALDVRGALQFAAAMERRACDYYATIAGQTRSEVVQELAQQFAEEESEHVSHLQRWIARGPA